MRSHGLPWIVALLALAAPDAAWASVAPGRVVLGPTSALPARTVDAGRQAGPAAVLPDGGAILAGGAGGRAGLTAVDRTGALVPSFGQHGVASFATPPGLFFTQLLRRPDGRLLLVGTTPPVNRFELPQLVVLGLTAAGAVDGAFGRDGVARPGIQGTCGSCAAAALARDGALLLAGGLGSSDPAAPTTGDRRAVVARLDATGRLDPAFGTAGVAAVPGSAGYAVGQAASGRVVVLGFGAGASQLTALTPSGAPDGSYAGGSPVALPPGLTVRALFGPSGRVDAVGVLGVTRITPDGRRDPAFGANGTATYDSSPGGFVPQVLPTPDGGLLVASRATYDYGRLVSQPALRVLRLSAAGVPLGTTDVTPGFGGGLASFQRSATRRGRGPGLGQDSFAPGDLLARADGSYLLPGLVLVVRYTGEGEGFSAGYSAAASLTPGFERDAAFGGPQAPAQLTVTVPQQRATRDADARRVLVRLRASGPGLALLRVRDGRRRVLAQSVEPVYAAGDTTVRIPLTKTGRAVLRGGARRVLVGYAFEDVLTARADGSRTVRLR